MNKRILWISIIVILIIAAAFLLFRLYGNPGGGKLLSGSQTYRQPHTYSLTYPKGWRRYGGSEKEGYEILALYSYNYRKVTDPGSGFNAGQIKIAVSILDLGQHTLEEIVKTEFRGTEKNFTQKELTINGHRAIRVSAVLETDDSLSPIIETFIEYKDHQYVCLAGYYNGAESAAQQIIKIQDSFQVLE